MQNFIALGWVQVGEKFRVVVVGVVGWVVWVGSFPLQKQSYTNLNGLWSNFGF